MFWSPPEGLGTIFLTKLINLVDAKNFLNKESHANASREDVTNYLQDRGFMNGAIRSNPHFIRFINASVPENRTSLVLPEREKAMRYLRDVVRGDPKLFGKRISRDDILTELREKKNYRTEVDYQRNLRT